MIKDKLQFGEIIDPLMKRFKALTKEQAEVYFDRLKFTDEKTLIEAVANLVDTAKMFPTPGDIKIACREASYKKAKEGKTPERGRGCPNCHDGYVFYERLKHDRLALYVGDCAYCHKGEVSIQAQVIQLNDQIFYACEQHRDGTTEKYRANPDIQELYEEATPVKTTQELKDRFNNE